MGSSARSYSHLALGLLVLLFVGVGAAIVLPFLPALLWATVLSILTFPLYARWKRRLSRVPRLNGDLGASVASLIATLFTLVIILIPFLMIGGGLFLQFSGVVQEFSGRSMEDILRQADGTIRPIADQLGAKGFSLAAYVQEHREQIVSGVRQPLTRFAGQAGFTILTLVIALLTQFFMLRDSHRLEEPAVELVGLPRERTLGILERVAETVRAVFVGTVLVAMIQGAIIGVAYAFVGVPNALLLGVLSAMLCIIPLLGAPVVYIPVGLALIAQGNMKGGLIILGVGFAIVSQIDNVLKPFFIGGRANLHPMAIFFSILGGVLLVGPIGVMAGPMALTILLALQDVVRERYAARTPEVVPAVVEE
ncbi:MAG: AI-2E family transporter [Fimbriimonas sp.]